MTDIARLFQAFLASAIFVSATALLILSINVRLMGIVSRLRQYVHAKHDAAKNDRAGSAVELEQESRRLKLVTIGIAVLFVGFLSIEASSKPRTIEAEKTVLLNSQGRARLTIGAPKTAGVAIERGPDDPIISLTDENGTDRAILSSDGLRFGNAKGKPLVAIISDPRPGRSRLSFYGPDGTISWSAPD